MLVWAPLIHQILQDIMVGFIGLTPRFPMEGEYRFMARLIILFSIGIVSCSWTQDRIRRTGLPVFFTPPQNRSKVCTKSWILFCSQKRLCRHFRWMAEHEVDGALLQRFASQCDLESGNGEIRRIRDEVGDRVREAAEKEGRTFAIMYAFL